MWMNFLISHLTLILVLNVCLHRVAYSEGLRGHIPRNLGPSTRKVIALKTREKKGTVIISTRTKTLDVVMGNGRAERYKIGTGRDGFTWTGTVRVGRKEEWPAWRPPNEMRSREKKLPQMLPAGPLNPLGARALYLYKNGADTLYRIHGTNDNNSIGKATSSGCFHLSNKDIIHLYDTVPLGAKVIVK